MSAKTYTYGANNRERTYRVLSVLLAYSDSPNREDKICCKKQGRVIFEIDKTKLMALMKAAYPQSSWESEIYPVLAHYLKWLGIFKDNRTTAKGSSNLPNPLQKSGLIPNDISSIACIR
jgi:hypothetical protein